MYRTDAMVQRCTASAHGGLGAWAHSGLAQRNGVAVYRITAFDCPSLPFHSAGSSAHDSSPTPLHQLGQYAGRVHLMRSDLPYASLAGSDPVPNRPNVYLLTGLPTYTTLNEVGTFACTYI